MSAATSLVRIVLETAERRGVSTAALLEHAGLHGDAIADRDARVPTPAFLDVFATAAERSGEPAFGSLVAGQLDQAVFGLLGFVAASCATLGQALDRFSRYSRLLCDELRLDVGRRGDDAVIVYEMKSTPYVPALFEMSVTHLVQTARRGTSGRFSPRRITFRHRGDARTLPMLHGVPIAFDAAENAVFFEHEALGLPLRGFQPALNEILDRHAAQVLAAMPREDELLARARGAVRDLLPRGEPSLEAAAKRLGIGARTLQRRLREQGSTFRALVDDVRREHAEIQLAHPRASVAEVAFALGFSTPSSFHHAYRRWTGRSPRQRA